MNCVVICCDTFRADMIGHDVVRTPNLDRLVSEGVNFTQAFAEGLPTIQARRTCFTGRRSFPWNLEMDSRGLWPAIAGWHRIPSEQTALAEHLYDNGVVTGLVGDTYHMFKATQNFTRGFCSWRFIRGQEGDCVRSGPLSAIDVSPYHPEGKNDRKSMGVLGQYLLNMLDRHTEEDYLPAKVFRDASTWVEENSENSPWFLWVDSFAPHERWDPPMEFADAYYVASESRNYIQPQAVNQMTDPSEDVIQRTRALYYGYVTFVDKWIGVLLDTLEQSGRMDDTAILFTSDHGTELWDRDQFGKGGNRLVDYNTRVPLVIRLPGGDRGGTTRTDLVQHQDLFPTVCRVLEIETPAELELDGRDVFDGEATRPDKVIIAWGGNVSVRSHDWNLVLDSSGQSDRRQLYDLRKDPGELQDVAGLNPDVVSEFVSFLEKTLGPLPYEIKHVGDRRQIPPHVNLIRD